MPFKIQICNPTVRDCSGEQRETLASAMIAVFPEATEDAILLWNWVPVRINYNDDLSVMMEDLLLMLDALLQSNEGSHEASFGASTFRARWSLRWNPEQLTIDSEWSSVAGGYEDLLNSRQTIEVPRENFLGEWKSLLRKVIEAVNSSGVSIDEPRQLAMLRRLEASIVTCGELYRGDIA